VAVSIDDDASHYVYTLMHIISIELQTTMEVNIHNQCSDFRLRYDGHFSNGADWGEYPDFEVDTDSMMSVEIMPILSSFGGVLMYKLQRKQVKSGKQPEPTHIRLFIAWKSESYKKLHVFVQLIKCDKASGWDETILEEYCQRYANQFSTYTGPVKDTWLMPDGTVLMTRLELDFTQEDWRDGVLSVTISKGVKDECTKKPKQISPKR
jgi:hypothetical protein